MKRIKYEVEITYDEESNMGYIYLIPIHNGEVANTKYQYPISFDLNQNYQIIGIEIFGASLHFPDKIKELFDKN